MIRNQNRHRKIGWKTCQHGWKNLREIWWTSYQHLLQVAEQTLQNHFVRLLFTPVEVQIGNTTCSRTSDCEICKRTNITRGLCRGRINSGIFRATMFCDTATAEQKRPQRRMRTAQQQSVRNRCASFRHWIQSYPWKTKTSQGTMRNPQKFLDPKSSPKVAFSANSFLFENLVKISDGLITRPRLIDPRPAVLQKGQCVGSKKRHQLSFCSPDSMNTVERSLLFPQ